MPTARRNQPHYNVDHTKRDKTRPWYVPGDEVHCDEPVLCETIGTHPTGWILASMPVLRARFVSPSSLRPASKHAATLLTS